MRPRLNTVARVAAGVIGGLMLMTLAVLPAGSMADPGRPAGPPAAGRAESGAPTGDDAEPGSRSRREPDGGPEVRAAPQEPTPQELTLAPGPVVVDVDGFFSWALLDRRTGKINGSANLTRTSTTESMVKVWIVADFLRRTAADAREPSGGDLAAGRAAIRDSDDGAAMYLYLAGGGDTVIDRMIKTCDLTETSVYPGWWSRTRISARDAVRLGDCVADGTAAGPEWTAWLLEEMRNVRGTTAAEDQPAGGRWGIIDGLPAELREDGVAIKNGWTRIGADNSWHLACLAVGDEWVLSVLIRYPAERSLDYGATRCAAVAEQLVHRSAPVGSPDLLPE